MLRVQKDADGAAAGWQSRHARYAAGQVMPVEGNAMRIRVWMTAAAVCIGLSACGPLLVGGAGVVVADQVAEDQNGGDGLF
jgi:hypothetical protein